MVSSVIFMTECNKFLYNIIPVSTFIATERLQRDYSTYANGRRPQPEFGFFILFCSLTISFRNYKRYPLYCMNIQKLNICLRNTF